MSDELEKKLITEGVSEKNIAVFLADTSGSVANEINDITSAINNVKQMILNNKALAGNTECAVIKYNDTVDCISQFGEVGDIAPLVAGGGTHYFEATVKAVNMILSAAKISQEYGIRTKAMLFNVTDGEPTDYENKQLAKEAIEYAKSKGVFTLALAVGANADKSQLKEDYVNVIDVKNPSDVKEAISTFSYQSLLTLSRSRFGSTGKVLEGTALEMNVPSGVEDLNDSDDFFAKFKKV